MFKKETEGEESINLRQKGLKQLRFYLRDHKIEQSSDSIHQGKVEKEKTKAGLSSLCAKRKEAREYKGNP